MNMFFMFLLIFFCIIGVVKTVSIVYVYLVQMINLMIFRKEEDTKIWTKP